MTRVAFVLAFAVAGCSDRIEPPPQDTEPERLVDPVDQNAARLDEAKLAGTVDAVPQRARYPHFYGLTNESLAEFSARAEERIALLEQDRLALVSAASAATDEGPRELLARVAVHLDEARDDLAEVRSQTGGPIFDDGRLGVSVAINRAQRALFGVREQLRAEPGLRAEPQY